MVCSNKPVYLGVLSILTAISSSSSPTLPDVNRGFTVRILSYMIFVTKIKMEFIALYHHDGVMYRKCAYISANF